MTIQIYTKILGKTIRNKRQNLCQSIQQTRDPERTPHDGLARLWHPATVWTWSVHQLGSRGKLPHTSQKKMSQVQINIDQCSRISSVFYRASMGPYKRDIVTWRHQTKHWMWTNSSLILQESSRSTTAESCHFGSRPYRTSNNQDQRSKLNWDFQSLTKGVSSPSAVV